MSVCQEDWRALWSVSAEREEAFLGFGRIVLFGELQFCHGFLSHPVFLDPLLHLLPQYLMHVHLKQEHLF